MPNLGAIVPDNVQNASISVPFGQLNSVLFMPANFVQYSTHVESQNPGIPIHMLWFEGLEINTDLFMMYKYGTSKFIVCIVTSPLKF